MRELIAPEEHVHKSTDPRDVPGVWGAHQDADTFRTMHCTHWSRRCSCGARLADT